MPATFSLGCIEFGINDMLLPFIGFDILEIGVAAAFSQRADDDDKKNTEGDAGPQDQRTFGITGDISPGHPDVVQHRSPSLSSSRPSSMRMIRSAIRARVSL